MKIAIAQINPTIADFDGNLALIRRSITRAHQKGADLVVFPELTISGYPPRDLIEQPEFIRKNREILQSLAKSTGRMGVVVGFVEENRRRGEKPFFNSLALLAKGKVLATRHKMLLPTYDVFDESRHFAVAPSTAPVEFLGKRIGISICEDMWHVPSLVPRSPYRKNPIAILAKAGVDLFINISASPFHRAKTKFRMALVRHHTTVHGKPFLFVNQVGGNDEILFDGYSFAMDRLGRLLAYAPGFSSADRVVDLSRPTSIKTPDVDEISDIRQALVMGIRDYVSKCGFKSVVLGLSGGIDSALTAELAVEALGPARVTGVLMPSEYSSRGSIVDALALARGLNISTQTIPIKRPFRELLKSLRPAFRGMPADVTEENLQARIRGTLLMALSNKWGSLLLTTGNKSELSMGYCTLYGDMNGGLAVISDVPKTLVYDLARFINRKKEIIPLASIEKAPSAELRPNQTDQDSLPPYEVLDAIIHAYIEDGKSLQEIVDSGFARDLVKRILNTIDRNEYKRRQSAPGLRISMKAFGSGRRYPIARGGFR